MILLRSTTIAHSKKLAFCLVKIIIFLGKSIIFLGKTIIFHGKTIIFPGKTIMFLKGPLIPHLPLRSVLELLGRGRRVPGRLDGLHRGAADPFHGAPGDAREVYPLVN